MNEAAYASIKRPLTPALLRLHPMFEPLRNDPRLQKLAAAAMTKYVRPGTSLPDAT
jgi:hypothetical protein